MNVFNKTYSLKYCLLQKTPAKPMLQIILLNQVLKQRYHQTNPEDLHVYRTFQVTDMRPQPGSNPHQHIFSINI